MRAVPMCLSDFLIVCVLYPLQIQQRVLMLRSDRKSFKQVIIEAGKFSVFSIDSAEEMLIDRVRKYKYRSDLNPQFQQRNISSTTTEKMSCGAQVRFANLSTTIG